MTENKGKGNGTGHPFEVMNFPGEFAVRELTDDEAEASAQKQQADTVASIERIRRQAAVDKRVAELRFQAAVDERVRQLRQQAADRQTQNLPYPVLRGHGFDH